MAATPALTLDTFLNSKYFGSHPGVKVLQELSNASSLKLLLTNVYGEWFDAGYIFATKAYNDFILLTWKSGFNANSVSPFTSAILWNSRFKKIIAVNKIEPVFVEAGSSIQIEYPF